jgi:hypothetical protein
LVVCFGANLGLFKDGLESRHHRWGWSKACPPQNHFCTIPQIVPKIVHQTAPPDCPPGGPLGCLLGGPRGVPCSPSVFPAGVPGGVPQGTLGILKVVGHRQAATASRTTFPGGPKSQKPMDGRQKPFCGENKVDSALGFCSGMPKTPQIFGSDRQNDEFSSQTPVLRIPDRVGSGRCMVGVW